MAPQPPGAAPEATPAEATAAKVLAQHCVPCHGENGSSDGGFDFAQDLARLARSPLVEPGDAAASRLYQRVAAGDMPPAGVTTRLEGSEVAALKAWIDEGAKASEAAQRLITRAEVKRWIDEDLAKLSSKNRDKVVYFDMSHVYGGSTAGRTDTLRKAFFKLVNSVSNASEIAMPEAVNAEKTLFRVNIDTYGWQEGDLSQLLAIHPFPLEADQPAFPSPADVDVKAQLQAPPVQTGTTVKYLHIDWFLKTASRAPFYYELLDMPSRLLLLEQKLGIDTVKNLEAAAVVRAGFANSQVAAQQRVIERHASPHGAYWRTFEFGSSQGNKNVFQNPLGPGSIFADVSERRFAADGHEVIYHLPNGLLGFAIFNGDGNRLDVAPSGQNDGIEDNATVNAGVSCMACHKAGFIDKEDHVRAGATAFADWFTKDEMTLITSLYKDAATVTAAIRADSRRFHGALAAIELAATVDDPVSTAARRYMEPMTVREAAAYLGLSSSELVEKVSVSDLVGQLLAGHVAADSIDRQFWEQNFRQILSAFNAREPSSERRWQAAPTP
jgi:hypothetical protein